MAVDGKISVRSGFAIDAIGASASTLVGGTGGNLNAAVNVKDIKAIDLTWGKYYWGGYHLLALDFRMSNGSVISMGSKTMLTPSRPSALLCQQVAALKASKLGPRVGCWTVFNLS